MDLWDVMGLKQSQILACTGAGGKTSLIQSLGECAMQRKLPLLITTTTKMFYHQVEHYNSIFTNSFAEASQQINIPSKKPIALFMKKQDDKLVGIPPEWIDSFAKDYLNPTILIEADGAAERLIKAPASHEPVIPYCTTVTVGVLNLHSIGCPLVASVAHRLSLLLGLLNKQEGQEIQCLDLVILATHPQGIFQHSRGRKVLLLTGTDKVGSGHIIKSIIQRLRSGGSDIDYCVTTVGWGSVMRPLEVYTI